MHIPYSTYIVIDLRTYITHTFYANIILLLILFAVCVYVCLYIYFYRSVCFVLLTFTAPLAIVISFATDLPFTYLRLRAPAPVYMLRFICFAHNNFDLAAWLLHFVDYLLCIY